MSVIATAATQARIGPDWAKAFPPTAMADVASYCSNPFKNPYWRGCYAKVEHIQPVDGWHLGVDEGAGSHPLTIRDYIALHEDGFYAMVHVTRYGRRFVFNQARFEWLVRNGFPTFPGMGNWDSQDVDDRIALDALHFSDGEAA